MKRLLVTLSVLLAARAAALGAPAERVMYEPSFVPDRSEIVFVSAGDIWSVPAQGGEARLLVSHPASERRPLVSPDGAKLAFVSDRTGNGDIYVLELGPGKLTRLTYDAGPEQLDAWSPDGKYVYFSSVASDISGNNDIYRVQASGGTPMLVSWDRYANEYFAAPSPADGNLLAITARGITSQQWWRNGHSYVDESEIWLFRLGTGASTSSSSSSSDYQRISTGKAKDLWPMWAPDGARLYFVSDRSGAENIWTKTIAGTPPQKQISDFKNGRVLWPSISKDGKKIVFERDFGIWVLDVATGRSSKIAVQFRGAYGTSPVQRLTLTDQFEDLRLSPDGKKLAFLAHGDVFVASAKDGGPAVRITSTAAPEYPPAWSPDSKRVVYGSARDAAYRLFVHDFTTQAETQLTDGPADTCPLWSPDGKWVAFVRGGEELWLADPNGKTVRKLGRTVLDKMPNRRGQFIWSPDSKWVASSSLSARSFRNVSVFPVEGGGSVEPRTISFLANTQVDSLEWSPDGEALYFVTSLRTETQRVARIDLVPRTPKFRESQFFESFKDAPAKSAAEPAVKKDVAVRIVFDGIRQRLTFVPTGLDSRAIAISPDGKTLLIEAAVGGQPNFYTYSLDPLDREPPSARQLTSTAFPKSLPQFSPDSKEVYFLERGRIQSISIGSRQQKAIAVTAETEVRFEDEKKEAFLEAWRYLRDTFWDRTFNGMDWEKQRDHYGSFVDSALAPADFQRVLTLMIGDLNSSHTGTFTPPPGPGPTQIGRLGVDFDRSEYESSGRLRVTTVVPLGPAEIAGVKTGDYLVSVRGTMLTSGTNLDHELENMVDRRVPIVVSSGSSEKRELIVRPVSTQDDKSLRYRGWVESRRAYVETVSKGRLGYVHLQAMGSPNMEQFLIDLDIDNHGKEGVVIDVRSNNGGFIDGHVLDVLARKNYQTLVYEGNRSAPQRTVYGQRSLELPTILVTNQQSLSDAECFAEGYRVYKLGKVVGEPTAGWVVSTGGARLVDGSTVRLPMGRTYTNDGADMERISRPVDVRVERPMGESFSGKDSQLDRAVAELLQQISASRRSK